MKNFAIKSTAIAVFVKTPGLSPLKTRLAATIGMANAEQFYRLSLKAIEKTLSSVNATPFWAVGEVSGLSDPLWQGFECIHTGEGGLGERQHHIYQSLLAEYEQVILIGADAPQLSPKRIAQAIAALDSHKFALGPAEDGGYYLFAGSAPLPRESWTSLAYSRSDTAAKLLEQLSSSTAILDSLTDVDTTEDLEVLKEQLLAEPSLTSEQQTIIRWINNLHAN